MRAIIAVGGKGTRMWLGSPKSLMLVEDKPLITYQLEQLGRSKQVDKIMMSFNTAEQEKAFLRALERYDFPKFDYRTSLHTYGRQMNMFLEPKVQEFVVGNDFLWSYGDLYYRSRLIESMVSLHKRLDATIVAVGAPKYHDSVLYSLGAKAQVIHGYANANMGLHMPVLIDSEDCRFLISSSESGKNENEFLVELLRRREVYGVKSPVLFNINTQEDLSVFRRYLKRRNK